MKLAFLFVFFIMILVLGGSMVEAKKGNKGSDKHGSTPKGTKKPQDHKHGGEKKRG